MAPQLLLILVVVIALPIAWLRSEFQERRSLRVALGVAALICSFGIAYVVGRL